MENSKRKLSEWICRISDKEYQKRIWIEGAGPECHDFDEAVNDFFAEVDHILENYQDYGLSHIQHQLLKKFRDEFRDFSDRNYWFPEIYRLSRMG